MSQTIIAKLSRSPLLEAANAAHILEKGAQLEHETASNATPPALLETYRERARHLQQFSSHHARRLQRATEELCANLACLQDECAISYARADDPLIGSYIIWYRKDSAEPVGVLYVIGKSEVPEDAWHGIWHDT